MSKILIVDADGVGLALAWRCAQYGHKVKLFIKPDKDIDPDTGIGFAGIEKVDNWVSHAKWADLIVPTVNNSYLDRLDFFRKQGMKVFGPTKESAALEIERKAGMEFLERHGIDVPEYKTFKTLKEAEEYVWKHEERFVFKPMGSEDDKSLTYCAKSPADMIARLQRWQKMGMNPKGEVMLQKFVDGLEFAVSRWMGTEGFIGLPNINWEHKPLMSSGCGPNTGEAGTVMAYVEQDRLFDDVLEPLEDELMKLGHVGDIDVNCIIDKKGIAYPLEFTMRMGWPSTNIMLVEHKGDPAKWMLDACEGKDSMQCSLDVAVGVVLGIPDYPYSKSNIEEKTGIPIYGVTKKNQKYLQPQAVKIEEHPDMEGESVVSRPVWTTAGDYVMVATGTGNSVRQAADRCYKTINEVQISNKMYRDDIGEEMERTLPELQKHGYAETINYDSKPKLAKAA